jgi:hypothetical protein
MLKNGDAIFGSFDRLQPNAPKCFQLLQKGDLITFVYMGRTYDKCEVLRAKRYGAIKIPVVNYIGKSGKAVETQLMSPRDLAIKIVKYKHPH